VIDIVYSWSGRDAHGRDVVQRGPNAVRYGGGPIAQTGGDVHAEWG
jgi:hypothetical protein